MSVESSSPLFTPPPSPSLAPSPSDLASDIDLAASEPPPIPGLFYFPDFLTEYESTSIIEQISVLSYFDVVAGRDQIVLFGSSEIDALDAGLPVWTTSLLDLIARRLSGRLPKDIYDLLYRGNESEWVDKDRCVRQLILNAYQPGQGISSHIDLPHKFLDGIMILSFGSGIAMSFDSVESQLEQHYSLYLTPRSLCILSGESRWLWKHGIAQRLGDWVWDPERKKNSYQPRGQRLSITMRWYNLDSVETQGGQLDHTDRRLDGEDVKDDISDQEK